MSRIPKIVFTVAGTWGVLVVLPLYFLESSINAQQPPPITHPEYYYGFVGVTLTWQVLFFVIAGNPRKYRLIMLVAIVEKLSYVLAASWLFVSGRAPNVVFLIALPDLALAVLFAVAYSKTPTAQSMEAMPDIRPISIDSAGGGTIQ